jgi:hypothetical protein
MNATDIVAAVTGVTKKWAKQRKAEERQANRIYNRRYVMARSSRVTIKDVAWDVMESAYLKASSNGQYPAHARQIYYAARPEILAKADAQKVDDVYFTQQLLPDYIEEHPEAAEWNVVFDARGHLFEPHTKIQVALGTLNVRQYLKEIVEHEVADVEPDLRDGDRFPTMGPANRYGAILFVEKEGFLPLFQQAKLAERYDIAIMSTKGMSNTASRELVDSLCGADVPLLVLHDFDKAGFSIVGTLQRDTRRYSFNHDVNVIDLGLRLEDVEKWKLQAEPCSVGKSDPTDNLRENGATDEEIAFLCSDSNWRNYSGQRVELNAFSSGDLLKWIETKLAAQRIKKIIPEAETLEAAYRRAAVTNIVDKQLEEIIQDAHQEVDARRVSPSRIARDVKTRLQQSPATSWDQAVADIAVDDDDDSGAGRADPPQSKKNQQSRK